VARCGFMGIVWSVLLFGVVRSLGCIAKRSGCRCGLRGELSLSERPLSSPLSFRSWQASSPRPHSSTRPIRLPRSSYVTDSAPCFRLVLLQANASRAHPSLFSLLPFFLLRSLSVLPWPTFPLSCSLRSIPPHLKRFAGLDTRC
jgi:hypothetical protein